MANNLEFILRLQDLLSPGMRAAATASGNATRNINNNMHQIERGADGANSGVNRLKSGVGSLMRMAAPLVAAFASFEFLKDSVKGYNDQEQAQAQLRASLTSTGNVSGLTAQQLIDQAEALQKVTLYGDETTEKMQSLLLTFTNIKGKVFTDAVPAIQDLATKLNIDLQSAATMVGKALNDPIQGINALKRVGVNFSDAQKDVIEKLVKTGETAKAQQLILKELNTEYGGAAAAAALAGTGPFTQLKNRLGDVQEEIGGIIVKLGTKLMPVLDGIVNLVSSVVGAFKQFYRWTQRNSDVIGTVIVAILGLASAVTIGLIAYEAYVLWTSRAAIWSGIQAALTAIEAGAMMGLGSAISFVNAAFIASPIGWIIISVIALVAIVGYLIYAFDGWGKTWTNLMDLCKYTFSAYKNFFILEWLVVQDSFMTGIELIEKGWYKLKSLWDEDGAAAGLEKINNKQTERAAAIGAQKGLIKSDIENAAASAKWEVTSNGKTLGNMVTDVKKSLGFGGGKGVSALGAAAGAAPKGGVAGVDAMGDGKNSAKGKADGINQGGQRSIVINIGKQIEKLEVHVMDAKEGVNEIESMVKEAMRRIMYSLNGTAS